MLTRLKLLAGVALVALLGTAMVPMGAAMAAEHVVVIENMKFGVLPAELHVGDTVIWQNNDIFRHTATAEDESFDVDLPSKSEGRMTVEKDGHFAFFCRFHPGMKGTLVVLP